MGQHVAIDLHQHRSLIDRAGEQGQRLQTIHIDNDAINLAAAVAAAGEDPEAVLEATCGWYRAADVLAEDGAKVDLAHPLGLNWSNRRVKNDVRDAKHCSTCSASISSRKRSSPTPRCESCVSWCAAGPTPFSDAQPLWSRPHPCEYLSLGPDRASTLKIRPVRRCLRRLLATSSRCVDMYVCMSPVDRGGGDRNGLGTWNVREFGTTKYPTPPGRSARKTSCTVASGHRRCLEHVRHDRCISTCPLATARFSAKSVEEVVKCSGTNSLLESSW